MTDVATKHPPQPRIARLLTEVLAPWVWCIGLPFAVAYHNPGDWLAATAWAGLVAIGAAVIPMGAIIYRMRAGSVQSGHHITTRTERFVPLMVAVASVTLLLAVLWLADAPAPMVAVTTVMLVAGVVCTAITRVWKISLHAGVSAGSAMVLTILYGPVVLPVWAGVIAVGWSRVKLGDHSVAQVLAGAALGSVTGLLYLAIA